MDEDRSAVKRPARGPPAWYVLPAMKGFRAAVAALPPDASLEDRVKEALQTLRQ